MKTFRKVLCVILSVIMAMSSLSAVAFAADDNKAEFTDSFRYYIQKEDAYGTDKLLDLADALLKEVNFYKEVDLKVTKITIDLTSVNGLCDTIDLIKSVWGLAGSEDIVGDLWELNFDVWESGMSRGSQDEKIIKELLEFLGTSKKREVGLIVKEEVPHTNSQVIAGLLDGSAKLGLLENFFSIEDLLGAGGIEAKLKELLLGNDYAAYKNDIDGWIYSKINGLAAKYLPGFTITGSSKINSLICLLFSLVINQYALPALKGLNIDLSTQENETLKKLNGYVVLDGSKYNFDSVSFNPDVSFLDQINNEVGKVFSQVVPGYKWVNGGYDKISENIEGAFKYLGKATTLIPDADSMSFEAIVRAVIEIIVNNVDLGVYDDGITECKTIEDMLKVILINASKEMGIDIAYGKNDTYLVVLGDIVAYHAYNLIDLKDTSGKAYLAGGGKDIFEVANYIANYMLFDKGMANLLGLSVKNTDTIFTKVDKLCDYFGETKSKGIAFDSKKFLLGSTDKKGLLDSVFTIDIQNIIEITAVPALEKAGDVELEKFLYNTVRYMLNNWAGNTSLIPAYQQGASFTNALSNKNIGNMLSILLSVFNSRSDRIITLIATVMSFLSSYKVMSVVYGVLDFVQNGSSEALDKAKEMFGDFDWLFDFIKGLIEDNKGLIDKIKPYLDVIAEKEARTYAVTASAADFIYNGKTASPKVTVKAGTKTLTQNKDYLVKTDAANVGDATAEIVGIGLYEGSFTVPFKVILSPVGKVTMSSTKNTVSLSWKSVPGASKYNVYMLQDGKYVLKQSTEATSYKAGSLKAATAYSFKIVAEAENGTLSAEKLVSTKTAPLAVSVKKIKASATDTTVTLSWSAVSGATGYRVEYLKGKTWTKINATAKTSYTVKKLNPYTEYSFRIISYVKDQNGTYIFGEPSGVKKVRTDVATVTGLKAATTASTISLSWKKAVNVSGYQIQQYKSGKWVAVTTIKKASTVSYKLSKLKAGTNYRFRVRAYNGKAYGDWVELSVYTNLVKAKNLKATKATTSSVTLKWDKVSGAAGYVVYRYSGGEWVKVATVKSNTATVSKLKAGTTYKFMVKAYKKVGKATVYGEASSTLSAKTALAQVKNLKASSRKKTSIALKWDKITGATGYYVERYNGKKWVRVGTVKTNTFTNKNLKRNTQYQYRVMAYGKVNGKNATGKASATLKVKTTLF